MKLACEKLICIKQSVVIGKTLCQGSGELVYNGNCSGAHRMHGAEIV